MCIWPTCYIHVCNCQGLFEPQQDPAPVILDLPPTCHNEKKKEKSLEPPVLCVPGFITLQIQ